MTTVLVNLASMLSVLIFLIFTHAALTPRRSGLCCTLVILSEAAATVLLRNLVYLVPSLQGWHTLLSFILYLAAILFLYRDRLWKRILAWVLIFVFTYVAELAAYAVLQAITGDAYAATMQFAYGQLIGTLIACAFETIIYSILVPIWKRIQKQEHLKNMLPLLLLPVGQVLIMISFIPLSRYLTDTPLSVWMIAASQVFFYGADIFWLFWIIQKSKRDETEMELHAAQAAAAAQQDYFRSLEESSRAIAKLRHDYKNQLSAISILLRQGKTEDAIASIGELNDYLDETRTPVWCSHAIVNAVLAEKSAECKAAGITPEFSIALPETLPVTPMQLSAVLVNLLDNAIRGISESESKEKILQLKTECRTGYLFIVTVNPSSAPGKLREGHGYGSMILRDIAEKNSGSYLTEYSDGIFRATVTLKLSEVKPNAAESSNL